MQGEYSVRVLTRISIGANFGLYGLVSALVSRDVACTSNVDDHGGKTSSGDCIIQMRPND